MTHRSAKSLLTSLILLAGAALGPNARAVDGSSVFQPGVLPKHWQTGGPDCSKLPPFQIHAYNDDFYILRESGCLHAEKPFLYLIFGNGKALLFDTGAGGEEGITVTPDVAGAVSLALKTWAKQTKHEIPALLVTHLHSHGDHTFGDAQLAALPNTTLIPPSDVSALQTAFGITNWPETIGSIDLGSRVIDIVPIPGHDDTSIAAYDRKTALLLTGDTMYPGRIYINSDPDIFAASIARLVDFTEGKPVAHVMGTHIEQRSPYTDYPVGTHYAPIEMDLAQGRGQLLEMLEATKVRAADGTILQQAFRDFSVCGTYPNCNAVNLSDL